MEESNSNSNFNKKRAEGRDKNDFPKKELQLKKRPRANPTSTISFVQVIVHYIRKWRVLLLFH